MKFTRMVKNPDGSKTFFRRNGRIEYEDSSGKRWDYMERKPDGNPDWQAYAKRLNKCALRENQVFSYIKRIIKCRSFKTFKRIANNLVGDIKHQAYLYILNFKAKKYGRFIKKYIRGGDYYNQPITIQYIDNETLDEDGNVRKIY